MVMFGKKTHFYHSLLYRRGKLSIGLSQALLAAIMSEELAGWGSTVRCGRRGKASSGLIERPKCGCRDRAPVAQLSIVYLNPPVRIGVPA
jgi:hypothetical protein